MLKSIFIIIAVGAISFFFTDINSASILYSSILPFVDFIVLIALAIWLVVLFHLQGIDRTARSGNVDTLIDFSGYDGGEGGGF